LNVAQCYEILELEKDASHKEIKQAYRKLSLRYHPDRNKGHDAERKFKEITHAYQILKMEQKKNNSAHKDVETAQAEFWKYYDKKTTEEVHFGYEAYRERLKRNFGVNVDELREVEERPVSHRLTHLLLYGGLGAIAMWIIISEILK
jgi:DnaJ-class molecular chaperone